MNELNPKATPGQIEAAITALKRTGNIAEVFDFSEAYDLLSGVSSNQLRYLSALIINNKMFEIKKFLDDKGFKHYE